MPEDSPVFELRLALTVDDFDRAVAFYQGQLGLPVIRAWDDQGGRGVLLDAGQAVLELLSTEQAAFVDQVETGRRHGGATVRVALRVVDSPSLAERLVAGGAERLGGPVDTPWGHRNVRLRAPDGTQLTLFTELDRPPEPR
jgi:catechol 2,3-dioxygenase-like lactoylglutathione lyase family enzyme